MRFLHAEEAPSSSLPALNAQLFFGHMPSLAHCSDQAEELVEPNAYGSLLQRSGAVGLNATTSHDATKYFMSLPANKLELWFALEAERFQVPAPARPDQACVLCPDQAHIHKRQSPAGRGPHGAASNAVCMWCSRKASSPSHM